MEVAIASQLVSFMESDNGGQDRPRVVGHLLRNASRVDAMEEFGSFFELVLHVLAYARFK